MNSCGYWRYLIPEVALKSHRGRMYGYKCSSNVHVLSPTSQRICDLESVFPEKNITSRHVQSVYFKGNLNNEISPDVIRHSAELTIQYHATFWAFSSEIFVVHYVCRKKIIVSARCRIYKSPSVLRCKHSWDRYIKMADLS